MKKLLVPLFIVAIAMLMPANMIKAGDGVDQNEQLPFMFSGWNCDGSDFIVGEGIFHIVSDFDILKKGYKYRYHINAHGEGVGMYTGDEYIWNDAINEVEVVNGLPYTFSAVQTFNLIGKGSAPNEQMHVMFKIMIDKDGNFKVLVDSYRFDCK